METKFTNGEWAAVVSKTPDISWYKHIVDEKGNTIALVLDRTRLVSNDNKPAMQLENEGNVKLILAAKDMYFALQDIIEQFEKTKMPVPIDLADSIRVFGIPALKKAIE
ncbi:MAG: hypothetical protein PHT07_15565 [Paludibacter sp.]|nr:hypothetical protein [Paludibacter sp.]